MTQQLAAELKDDGKEEGGGKKRRVRSNSAAQRRYRARQKEKVKELHNTQAQLASKVKIFDNVKRTCASLQVWLCSADFCFHMLDHERQVRDSMLGCAGRFN